MSQIRAEDSDQRVILHGMDWWQYETFLAIRGDRRGVRVTYLEGDLEIMRSSRTHEWRAKLMSRLLEAYTDDKELVFEGYGSMTLRNPPEQREIPRSVVIPGLTPSFIREFLDCETQTEAVQKLRAALRK